MPDFMTPGDVAERLGLRKLDTIYSLIRTGAIAAVNVAAGSDRPTWRISEAALHRFVESRTAVPMPKAGPRSAPRRRAKVTKYF
jgi:excisionase family DNA binding protein